MKLSIVVVNWNSRDDLAACLASLEAQTHRDLEVIVVDNGSTDGSEAMVREQFPHVTLLDTGENLGFAEGCNRGIAASRAAWVVMLNNDAIADPRWAEHISRAAEDADARCGMLQSVLLFQEPKETINSTGITLDPQGSGHDRDLGKPFSNVHADEIFCPTAGAAAYRRSMLDAIVLPSGWFDRDHFMYSEDLDLGWRARLAGWSARVVPEAIVHHKHMGSSARRGRAWLVVMSRTNRFRTLIKNASPSLFLRALPRTLWEIGEVSWYGGPRGALKLVPAAIDGLRKRRVIESMTQTAREDVERRWLGR